MVRGIQATAISGLPEIEWLLFCSIHQKAKPNGQTVVLMVGIEAALFDDNAVAAGNQVNKNELIVTRLLCRSHRAKQKERVV
jgi:hypothetical protein